MFVPKAPWLRPTVTTCVRKLVTTVAADDCWWQFLGLLGRLVKRRLYKRFRKKRRSNMGGLGSGLTYQYWRPRRKTTVEECKVLLVKSLRELGMLKPNSTTSRTLTWAGCYPNNKSTFGITVNTTGNCPHLVLSYRIPERNESFEYEIRLSTSKPPFGGLRWWLRCPIRRKSGLCDHRVTKLYLPIGQRYVGCRDCYDLGYRSCQEAHKYDRLFAN